MTAWTLPGRFGPEAWRRNETGFAPLEIGAQPVAAALDAAGLDRIGARATRCDHPGPMPGAFCFCPDCGTPLADPSPIDRSPPWSPPFGAADGLPDVPVLGAPDPASHGERPVPPSPAIGFAVAGSPARLLCCDRIGGWVSAWSGGEWYRLARLPPCPALPRWSWSAAATEAGLAVPTEQGPAFLRLTAPLGVESVLAPDESRPAGGAILIGDVPLMPVWQNERLHVAALISGRWQLHPVSGAPSGIGDIFASPIGVSDAAFWWNAAGQLDARFAVDGIEARFLPWTDGIAPLLDCRPVLGRDGTPHLLCRLDDTTLVLESLVLPGQPRSRRVARSYAPGSGRAVFRENTRARLPWDERPAYDYPLPDDRFLYPLLALGEDRFVFAVCSDRARLGAFLGDPLAADDADAPPLVCSLAYSRGPRMLQPLDCVLRARRASDLAAILHAGQLLVHGAVENRLHSWTLRDAL